MLKVCSVLPPASESSGAEFAEMFHPGVYNINPGRFTCCYNIDRYSQGCQKTTFCPSRQQEPKSEPGKYSMCAQVCGSVN